MYRPSVQWCEMLNCRVLGLMERRLEDRIRKLCAEVVNTPHTDQGDEIIVELNAALREHIRRARRPLLEFSIQVERRSAS
jgi:hypothetical protein